MTRVIFVCLCLSVRFFQISTYAQTLALPERNQEVKTASELIKELENLPREEREKRIFEEIEKGNIPNFLRKLWKVEDSIVIGKKAYHYIYYCTPDYLAVGSDDDYVLMPMSAKLAQRISDLTQTILPTPKMVDQIYQKAPQKLRPQPIPPSPKMTTILVFSQHDSMIKMQRDSLGMSTSSTLIAGHKKDIVISYKISHQLKPTIPKPVVIYGWHRLNGKPIQPVYNGHGEKYADYSHGVRLVHDIVWINGKKKRIRRVLKSKKWNVLLSNEGRILTSNYNLK